MISDGHCGIQDAVKESFVGAYWQMCDVNFERAALKTNEKKDEQEIANKIMTAIENET